MIEFNGELSGNAKKFLLRKQAKIQTIAASIVCSFLSVPVVWLSLIIDNIFFLALIPLVAFVIISLLTPDKHAQKTFMPKRIFIDTDENTIVHICEKSERFHMLQDVKIIEDHGEWYYFIFNFESRDPYFVCQKDLGSPETIKNFELIFQDKIVKINPNT